MQQDAWFGGLAGVPIAAFSSIPLLTRFLPRRGVVTVACSTALAWGILCFTLLPDAFETADIPAFVVQGVILVAAAVTLLAANADLLIKTTSFLSVSGRTLAARLAFAYPLARRFRTSMLLGMYAIVIFTITFISTFSNLFSQQSPRVAREAGGGFDLVASSNPANPVSAETLAAQPGVTAVAPLLRALHRLLGRLSPGPESFCRDGVRRAAADPGRPQARQAPRPVRQRAGDVAGRAAVQRPGHRVGLLPPGGGRPADPSDPSRRQVRHLQPHHRRSSAR